MCRVIRLGIFAEDTCSIVARTVQLVDDWLQAQLTLLTGLMPYQCTAWAVRSLFPDSLGYTLGNQTLARDSEQCRFPKPF